MRRGVALVAALVLIAVTGMLVAGSVASSVLAQHTARLSASDAELTAAADYAIGAVLGGSDDLDLASLTFGVPTTFTIGEPWSAAGHVAVSVTRLPSAVLWLVADARSPTLDGSERRVNVIARFPTIGAVPAAGLTARGSVHVGAGVAFSADSSGDPTCPSSPRADVVLAAGATVSAADSVTSTTSALASDTATYYLAAWQLALIDSAGTRAVHVRGDTTITSGTFDGVMVVDGVLTIAGAWNATGVVAARGRIDASSGTVTVTGAMLSFAADGALPAIAIAAGGVRYAPCAVARALRRIGAPRPVPDRSWMEVF